MHLLKKSRSAAFIIAIIMLAALSTAAQTSETAAGGSTPPGDKEQNTTEQQQAGDDIKELKSKLEQLQAVIEQQQRMLTEMQKRIDEVQSRTLVPASASSNGAVTTRASSVEIRPQSQSRPEEKPAGIAGWNGGHPFIRSADGNLEAEIAGYGQLDFRAYQSGDHPPNTLLVRRARLAVEGKLQRYYEFRVEGDFADTTSTLLRDFFVNIRRRDELQLRFGQFRVPMSQEEMRSDSVQDFVERSMANNLVPSRSPGFMVSGVIDKGVVEYQVGAFNGKGLLALNNNGTPEGALRLRFSPWKHSDSFWSKGLIFGGAFTAGRTQGGASVRGQTESRSFTFFTPDVINGKYIRANGEITWLLGPAAIRAEYDQTNQRRDNLGPAGGNLPGVVGKGYVAQFTYMLTGEEKPEADAVDPNRDLFSNEAGEFGFGAWELKFRYANLQISDATAKSNRAESFYFGPNWYLNRYVRYLLDVGVERFKDPTRTPTFGDRTFLVLLTRVQVAF
jgi:phosphate-selective porin OprO/OprP